MGAALSSFQVADGTVSASLAQSQFNSLTPEFQLKPDVIAPTEGVFDFTGADELVDWAIANGMDVRGHALLWHEATPAYFLQGTNAEIRARLETYITTVVEHFRGRLMVSAIKCIFVQIPQRMRRWRLLTPLIINSWAW